jgi:hypothetical protein
MNERIRELAEQAGSTHKQNLGVYQFYTEELEKFAELIVRECCNIVVNCGIPGSNTERDFVVASREIRHYFGVEE